MTVIGPNFVFLPGLTPWNLFFPLCLWGINHLEPDPKSSRVNASLPLTAADFGLLLSKLSWALGSSDLKHITSLLVPDPSAASQRVVRKLPHKIHSWNRGSGKAFHLERGHSCPQAHQVTYCQSLITLQCLRVHCLALPPPGSTRPGPGRQWHTSPQSSRGLVGLCCRQVSTKGRSGSCETGLGRHSIRKVCCQLPPLLPRHHFWSEVAFLVVASISLSGLHSYEVKQKVTHLNTALGGFRTYCFMGAI